MTLCTLLSQEPLLQRGGSSCVGKGDSLTLRGIRQDRSLGHCSTCCGLIGTDTSKRVIRSAAEVSNDDRETPNLYGRVQARGRPPRDGAWLWCRRRRTEFGA